MDDWRRLKQYAHDGSEAAFAEIIRQHTDLVYSVCLREIGDTMLAEEATQAVFLVLAQKAATLRQEAALASWLFATARLTSRSILRRERRRQRREEQAAQDMAQAMPPETPRWEDAEPLLNDALSTLSAAQRSLIILRFWENRPLADIGLSLGISEDAARMRLSRALDRLRRWLSARNVALSAAALAAGLPLAVRPAPARCAEALTHLPLPPAAPPDPAFPPSLTAQGVLRTMNTHRLKLQWGAAAVVACLSLGTAEAVQVSHQRHAQTIAAAQKAQQKQNQAAAMAVLDQMYATYAAMHSFRCVVTDRVEPSQTAQDAEYIIQRPDKFRLERTTLAGPQWSGHSEAINDGHFMYVTSTESGAQADRYAKLSLTPSQEGRLKGGHYGKGYFYNFGGLASLGKDNGMPAILFGQRLGEEHWENMLPPEYSLGQPAVMRFPGNPSPVAVDVVIARIPYQPKTPGLDWPGAAETITYYIGQKDHLLYEMLDEDPRSRTQTVRQKQLISQMSVNQPIDVEDFTFTPPSGSHEVSDVGALYRK